MHLHICGVCCYECDILYYVDRVGINTHTLTVLRNSAMMVLYWSLISLTTLSLRLSAAVDIISIIRINVIMFKPDLKMRHDELHNGNYSRHGMHLPFRKLVIIRLRPESQFACCGGGEGQKPCLLFRQSSPAYPSPPMDV